MKNKNEIKIKYLVLWLADSCNLNCKYCYANAEPSIVMKQSRLHNPKSPFLIGNYEKNDSIHDVPQQSWVDGQMSLF